ncbi:MAG: hypothetical protein IKZ57_00640 [Spirochaetia bacterium]|nr:hypothetical protein [Spirochaetia bacterium]
MEENTQISNPVEEAMQLQIAELRAQVEKLEKEKGQAEFDRSALKSEQDKLRKRIATLEDQNQYLRGRNKALSDEGLRLQGDVSSKEKDIASKATEIEAHEAEIATHEAEIADLKEQLDQLEQLVKERETEIAALNEQLDHAAKEREASEAAYQAALAKIDEYNAHQTVSDATLTEANTTGTRVTEKGDTVSTFGTLNAGQTRNILGIKIGGSDIDIEGTFALMPHWFLIGDLGAVEVPKDFVKDEFPGLTADHAFVYTALFGTGLNWRFNSIQSQPNIYLATMAGPAWYLYKEDNRNEINTYLLWRSSIGFDMTLYKNLQFTTDLSVDWMKNYGFTPHLTVGLQWSFSNSWALFGGR